MPCVALGFSVQLIPAMSPCLQVLVDHKNGMLGVSAESSLHESALKTTLVITIMRRCRASGRRFLYCVASRFRGARQYQAVVVLQQHADSPNWQQPWYGVHACAGTSLGAACAETAGCWA